MKNTLEKKILRKTNGVTLVALILTIIVLIIIAGITIGMLLNDDGIINKATEARNATIDNSEAEKVQMAVLDAMGKAAYTEDGLMREEMLITALSKFFKDVPNKIYIIYDGVWIFSGEKDSYEINKNGKWKSSNAKLKKDRNGDKYALPKDAKYKEGTVNTGLVISYKGSEFVWVPINQDLTVKGTSKLMARPKTGSDEGTDSNGRIKYESVLYDFFGEGENVDSHEHVPLGNNIEIEEPTVVTGYDSGEYDTVGITQKMMQEDYDAMIESVKKYGGFYIARYESSLENNKIVSKAGLTPICYEIGDYHSWYDLYSIQKGFSHNEEPVASRMIWGCQWDAMLNWAIATGTDKAKVTQYDNANHDHTNRDNLVTRISTERDYQTTGKIDLINNIYDLEGLMSEWTQEGEVPYNRTARGSFYYERNSTNSTPNKRSYSVPKQEVGTGSRMCLYIND